jgi:hypothetical protein
VARFAQASRRQGVVWAMVVGGHLCAVAILVHRYAADRAPAAQEPLQVVLLALPERLQRSPPQELPRARPRRPPAVSAVASVTPAPPDETAVSTPPAPAIDWNHEARAVAEARIPAQPPQRICGKTELTDPRRPDCRKAPRAFEWNPQVPRVGMDGLFPYVRVGDTCVVGLGFFSCHEKMPANDHLFEDMKNPDASASSVPDAPN